MITMDAILLGGGVGKRYSGSEIENSRLPKQFQLLGDFPVFIHALKAFERMKCFRKFVFVVPKAFLSFANAQLEEFVPDSRVLLAIGGEERQDSSKIALELLDDDKKPERIIIHDACRPFLAEDFLERMKEKLLDRSLDAWVPVVPVTETLKRVQNSKVVETIDRSTCFRVQTPQIFDFAMLHELFQRPAQSARFTDDASLCEHYGIPVGVFEGETRNLKLTYEFEMQALSAILAEPKEHPCVPESATTFTA
jgi:2-C-methyl-D-erythritol 4-phosphate cytidylyltransferase